jgi:DNA-binding NarL/FixJ family response regulator
MYRKDTETNHLPTILLADNQDITAAGIYFFIKKYNSFVEILEVANKRELITELLQNPHSLIVLDYALFDFSSPEELIILQHRFPASHFLLFSEELTDDFLKRITCEEAFSVVLKDCSKEEIEETFQFITRSQRYICARVMNQLSSKKSVDPAADTKLTPTEKEVLRLIALGKSTKDIASERFLSIHTVITHRKNIFRKLEVNNLQEATKYALRAGIIDASDYYI